MKKMLIALFIVVLAVFAFGSAYEWESAPICGSKSGTNDTTFVPVPGFSHAYGVAVAGNGRVFTASYYGSQRYDAAVMVYDPEYGLIDTIGPDYDWDDSTYTMGACRNMATLADGNILMGNWGPEFLTVFDQDDYSVVAQSPWCNSSGGVEAFAYDGEQYYLSQQILASGVVIWDNAFNIVDTLEGGPGGRNLAVNEDGSVIISPGLGSSYFVEWRGNPDDGYVNDTIYVADLCDSLVTSVMYVSAGPNDYFWLMSRDASDEGVLVVDPANDYELMLSSYVDSAVTSIDGFDLGIAVDNMYNVWLAAGSIDTSDVYTTLGYHQPWILRAPCQVAYSWSGSSSDPEYLYLADFYGYTLKSWSRTTEVSVSDNVISENGFKLNIAYPNPFNPSVTIPYELSADGHVAIDVYDVAGKKVASLVNENRMAGSYDVHFNASDLASGNYLVKMTFANKTVSQKISLVK